MQIFSFFIGNIHSSNEHTENVERVRSLHHTGGTVRFNVRNVGHVSNDEMLNIVIQRNDECDASLNRYFPYSFTLKRIDTKNGGFAYQPKFNAAVTKRFGSLGEEMLTKLFMAEALRNFYYR